MGPPLSRAAPRPRHHLRPPFGRVFAAPATCPAVVSRDPQSDEFYARSRITWPSPASERTRSQGRAPLARPGAPCRPCRPGYGVDADHHRDPGARKALYGERRGGTSPWSRPLRTTGLRTAAAGRSSNGNCRGPQDPAIGRHQRRNGWSGSGPVPWATTQLSPRPRGLRSGFHRRRRAPPTSGPKEPDRCAPLDPRLPAANGWAAGLPWGPKAGRTPPRGRALQTPAGRRVSPSTAIST